VVGLNQPDHESIRETCGLMSYNPYLWADLVRWSDLVSKGVLLVDLAVYGNVFLINSVAVGSLLQWCLRVLC